jgi:hypothetical protein
VFLAVLASSGCAAVGLAFLSIGAGTAATSGVSYTLDSIAYKTFTAPEEGLQTATLKTLARLDIKVKEIERTQTGSKIVAEASDRTIEIELERLTTKISRMRVNAKRGWLLKDRATATEIIIQTERTLDHEPMLTRGAPAPAAVPARTVASRAVAPRPQQGERESSAP